MNFLLNPFSFLFFLYLFHLPPWRMSGVFNLSIFPWHCHVTSGIEKRGMHAVGRYVTPHTVISLHACMRI